MSLISYEPKDFPFRCVYVLACGHTIPAPDFTTSTIVYPSRDPRCPVCHRRRPVNAWAATELAREQAAQKGGAA